MADRVIEGKVVFADAAGGIKGLKVAAFDLDILFSEQALGKPVETDADGKYSIKYSLSLHNDFFLARNPDVVVRVFAPGGRLLHETAEETDAGSPLQMDDIKLHSANLKGWLVTNATLNPDNPDLKPTGEPVTWTAGNKIKLLNDGVNMFPAVTDAIGEATDSIHFVNINFWVTDSLITKFPEPNDANFPFDPASPKPGKPVIGNSIHKIMRGRTLAHKVKPPQVLVEDFPFIDKFFFTSTLFKSLAGVDSADEVKEFFKDTPVEVRLLSLLLNFNFPTFLHSKAVILDSKSAFVLGSPIGQGYFGAPDHLITDPRHGGSLKHDVSIKVEGPAVEHVDRGFALLWNAADAFAAPVKVAPPLPEIPGGIGVQVVRTLPGGVFTAGTAGGPGFKHGETGCLEAYQRAIANATKYIYLEDQYFTAEEIFAAILARMEEVPALELIIVMNSKPDTAGYPQKQIRNIKQLRARLAKKIGQAQMEKRVGIFTLWSCNQNGEPYELMPIYVHAKAAVIDDVWATVGSANLDGASMNQIELSTIVERQLIDSVTTGKWYWRIVAAVAIYIFARYILLVVGLVRVGFARKTQHANPQQTSQPTRSSELNVVICEKNPDAAAPNPEVVRIREELWREHLGLPTLPATAPADGWVSLWKEGAKLKLDNILLDAKSPKASRTKYPANILAWVPKVDAEPYLKELIKARLKELLKEKFLEKDFKKFMKMLNILEDADSFDFNKGVYNKRKQK